MKIDMNEAVDSTFFGVAVLHGVGYFIVALIAELSCDMTDMAMLALITSIVIGGIMWFLIAWCIKINQKLKKLEVWKENREEP